MQQHPSGESVMLLVLPGPFGTLDFKLMDNLDSSATAKKGLGLPAGGIQLRWFFADEPLEKTLLNEPATKHTLTPLRDLYECSEHFLQSGARSTQESNWSLTTTTWASEPQHWSPAG